MMFIKNVIQNVNIVQETEMMIIRIVLNVLMVMDSKMSFLKANTSTKLRKSSRTPPKRLEQHKQRNLELEVFHA